MTVLRHPDDDLLIEYASGALHEGWSLCVACHLALCPECRARVAAIESLGGGLLEECPPEAMRAGALDDALARLGDAAAEAAPPARDAPAGPADAPVLPEPLRGYVGADAPALAWRRLGRGARHHVIPLSEPGVTARLLRIPAGKPVPRHTHRGLELTLVLQGAFSDETGSYRRGDLEVADEGLSHQPIAAPGADCICLAVTDAPLRFDGLAARVAQRFLDI